MAKCRSKKTGEIVNAVKYNGANFLELNQVLKIIFCNIISIDSLPIIVKNSAGTAFCYAGDYLARTETGELWVYKEAEFEEEFDTIGDLPKEAQGDAESGDSTSLSHQFTWEAGEGVSVWNNGTFNSIEECVEEAKRTGCHKAGDTIYVGECFNAQIGGVDLSGVLECVEENMYEQVGEVSEGWDVSVIGKERKEIYEKYEKKLQKLVEEYISEIGETPGFYRVTNIKPIVIF